MFNLSVAFWNPTYLFYGIVLELILCLIDKGQGMLKLVSEMLCAQGGQKMRSFLCAQISGFHTSKVK